MSPETEKLLLASFTTLQSQLTLAQERMKTDSRRGVMTALGGVIDFISSIPRWNGRGLEIPFKLVFARSKLEAFSKLSAFAVRLQVLLQFSAS
jgi:hypothetical protein